MLLTRYSDINFILELEFNDGIKMIVKASEGSQEEKVYQRWLVGGYDKEMSYEDFKKELTQAGKDIDDRKIDKSLTQEDILKEQENILNQFRR